MLTRLLQEDIFTPDSRRNFIDEMEKKFNVKWLDCMAFGIEELLEDRRIYHKFKGFILEFSSDDTHYTLYKEQTNA